MNREIGFLNTCQAMDSGRLRAAAPGGFRKSILGSERLAALARTSAVGASSLISAPTVLCFLQSTRPIDHGAFTYRCANSDTIDFDRAVAHRQRCNAVWEHSDTREVRTVERNTRDPIRAVDRR